MMAARLRGRGFAGGAASLRAALPGKPRPRTRCEHRLFRGWVVALRWRAGELASRPATKHRHPPYTGVGQAVAGAAKRPRPPPSRVLKWAEGPPSWDQLDSKRCANPLARRLGSALPAGTATHSLCWCTQKLCSRERAPKGCAAAFGTKGRAPGSSDPA